MISPFTDDLVNAVTNRKPKAILIEDDTYELSNWQDVFVTFIRWIKENRPEVFKNLLDNDEYNFTGVPIVSTRKCIESLKKTESELLSIKKKFKRLSDQKFLTNVANYNPDEEYVYINQSAKSIMERIKNIIDSANMSEDSVQVELLEQ